MSCAICRCEIDNETAPIIAMGGFGQPRYICDGCAKRIDVMNESLDSEEIRAAMSYLAETMSNNASDDMVAHNAVKVMLIEAGDRLKKIEDGSYIEEEASDGELLEIPEELVETEEDIELDRQDKIKLEKFDKVFNWISIGLISAVVIAAIIYFIIRFT